MLDIKWIRAHKDEAIERLAKRGLASNAIIEEILTLDEQRRNLQTELDALRSKLNSLSKEIGKLMREGKKEEAENIKQQTTQLKSQIEAIEQEKEEVDKRMYELLITTPNFPHPDVPAGEDESDNVIVEQWGEMPKPPVKRPHWEIAYEYGLINFKWGSKLAGSGFVVFTGWGARLQDALIRFFLDNAVKNGYVQISPPHLVNEDTGFGTGQLPDKDEQMYYIEKDELYLIPTAEVPVTNLFRNTVVKAEDLPVRMVSYTPCYRREAGSYGQMTRGLNRVHQFDKVEIVHIAHPNNSYEELERMCEYVGSLLQKLEIPYRRVLLCGGDLGFAAAKTYDMEVYAAGQDRWLEASSISNFETFQSLRMNLKGKDGKKTFIPYTLNGSALALPRIIAAMIENNVTAEGIRVPKALAEYLGTDIIPKGEPLPIWGQD